jgi:AraC-like DNA-binding protein
MAFMGQQAPTNPGSASVALIWPFLSIAPTCDQAQLTAQVRQRLGLSASQFADPSTRVPIAQFAEMLDRALARTGQRDIGLLAAHRVESVHLGLTVDVARSRDPLQSALEAGIRFLPLVGDCVQFHLEVAGDRVTSRFAFDPDIQIHEAAVEFVIAVSLMWARRTTGVADLAPLEIHFTHPKPADTSRHEQLFLCPLHFGAPATQIVMSKQSLEKPLGGAEPLLATLSTQRAETLLQELSHPHDTAARVRQLLSAETALRNVSAQLIAKRLGIGTRTLARRLSDENTSYREVLNEVRKDIALAEITRGERTTADIAYSLGFASPQGLYRAFRRWTGGSTSAYRRSSQ